MSEGSDTYKGLAVPLNGNFEIQGITALDIMTLTNAASTSGDFIVCQSQNGTEVFVVEDAGNVTVGGEGLTITSGGLTVTAGDLTVSAGDIVVGDGHYLRFAGELTTKPTTGLTLGDMFVYQAANNYKIGVCTDTAANNVWALALA